MKLLDEGNAMLMSGHADGTNYSLWRHAGTDPYSANCSMLFDPIFVIRLSADRLLPRYDERFIGSANDKASYAMKLFARGYRFVVDPTEFVYVMAQGDISSLASSGNKTPHWECTNALMNSFAAELAAKYGRENFSLTRTRNDIVTLRCFVRGKLRS